jgi:hypothetical protein
MATFKVWKGCRLNWIDDDRDGMPREDLFGFGHVLNPYYFSEDGARCACRLCEPLLWKYEPFPPYFDFYLPTEPPRAKNGCPWSDLDAEFYERQPEFTPL